MKSTRIRLILFVIIPLISIVMHWRIFSVDLISIHSWRQTQTQSNIDNLYEEDFNIFNPRRNERGNGDGIFRMEFPIMQWLIAGGYKIFGPSIWLTRVANFLFGLLAVFSLFYLIRFWFNDQWAALIGAWGLTCSPAFFYYTVNPLPDNFALATGLAGLALFLAWVRKNKYRYLWGSSLFFALSVLAKLPFILYFSIPALYFLLQLIRGEQGWSEFFKNSLPFILALLPPLSWYAWVIPQWQGNEIVRGIFSPHFDFAEWLDFLQHNIISTLPELLLNYGAVPFFIFGLYYLFVKRWNNKNHLLLSFMGGFLAVAAYCLFELHLIGRAHDYYLFPFFPFLFLVVAKGAQQLLAIPKFWRTFSLLLLILLPIFTIVRMQSRWDTVSPGFNSDFLIHKEALRAAVPNEALCVLGNDVSHYIFFYYADKKGWGFHENQLSSDLLGRMIEEGAEFLYSDSRVIDETAEIKPHLEELIWEGGSIKIFRLRK